MHDFQYEPLEADEIRLFELFAGDPNAQLSGRIHRFRLPEDDEPVTNHEVLLTREGGLHIPNAPRYSALSYTWGKDSQNRQSISVLQNGQLCQLGIKTNLYDALKRLRRDIPKDESRMIWADAICIHQSYIPEKNAQIQKMAMIYNRAESVSVWLGNEDRDSGRAFDFIERLLRLEDFDPLTQDPGTPTEWAALHNLMQRPWFNRRWIVQEISLARSATLYCGNQSVSWPDFSAATALFVARHRDLRHLFQGSKDFQNHPNYLGEVEALGAKSLVDITTNLFRKSDDGVVLERLLSLEALISTLTLFEAGSPHDTIYAVLWLAHDAEPHSRESAAMSMEPLVRTPTQSPEIEQDPSQFDSQWHDFSQRPYSGEIFHSPRASSPTASQPSRTPQDFNQKSGLSKTPTRRDTFLKPPPRRPSGSKPARSASDLSKMMAETHFQVQPHSILVDYNADTFDVFSQFLDFAISRSRSLDIICHPWAPEPLRGAPALPTWIPQLSNAPFEKRPGQNSYGRVRADSLVGTPGLGPRNYNASGKTKMYPPKDFIRGRTLIATGFQLDAIKEKKSPAVEGILPGSWLDLVDWSGPPEPVPDRLWRTLVADRGPGGQKYPPAYYPLACKWVFEQRSRRGNINTNELLTFGKCPSIATEFLRRVQSVVWDRMLVLTEGRKGSKKLLALVPPEAEEGDLICILYGCSVPVVLRRQRKRKAKALTSEQSTQQTLQSLPINLDSQHQYQVIGECYVHGMMAGEGFKHQKDHGNKLRAFHLV
ncbi:hypothetical protein M433DRAFT_61022 [Acidomyces richmondensis BFW]|nr:MAG: hypothetical protein FE78DRAFT_136880 [Acidomyces sp. 'richmondensis']KYG48494.1 hypothetical protein M433DRAFT_61022 [Acidomyces richmondensis BFW]